MKQPTVKVDGKHEIVRSVSWDSRGGIALLSTEDHTLFAPNPRIEQWTDSRDNVYEVEFEEETK